jgi:hypothetical protein
VKAHAVVPAQAGPDRVVGWVVCHDVHDAAGRLTIRKGSMLDRESARRLAEIGTREVHLIELEAGDVHEDVAGERLARALASEGVEVRDSSGGQWALSATRRGLVEIQVAGLTAVNGLDGISAYTLYDGQVVDAAEVVARTKVTPLVIGDAVVVEAERRCRAAGGLVAVRPFLPVEVAAVAPANLAARARTRFDAVLREKLGWFGARLLALEFVESEAGALARAIGDGVTAGAHLVVAAGANALDPLDPVFTAVEHLGGRLVRRGVPAHPGSLLWMARLDRVTILGMPSCGMFSQATLFDLILPRLIAGRVVGPAELAAFGHGGLLGRDMAFRFPPYRAGQERGALPD